MQLILFDDQSRYGLMPFTRTRPVADIRCGIFTMRERWEKLLEQKSSSLTEAYLQPVFPLNVTGDNLMVNGGVFASTALIYAINTLQPESKLVNGNVVLAARTTQKELSFDSLDKTFQNLTSVLFEEPVHQLKNTWDIFSQNDRAIRDDFAIITHGKKSDAIPEGVIVVNKENLFIEPGAIINAGTVINAATGPVYLAKDAEILEGCMLRGPIAVGKHAVLKMGAKIYGGTTIGEGCKVGGEISNVVFFANSNKGHDGYLGNAVIGEWCNLGADTNCSNLKNNYDEIKIWDDYHNKSVKTGLQFCGLLMGDHSKCGINTMFNTGTVAGVSCNIYGGNFPEKFIPSFSWGGSEGMVTYDFNRAMDTANRMMSRRNKSLSEAEIEMYRFIFEQTTEQRNIFAK